MYNIKYIVFVMFFKCMTKRISTFLHFHSFYTWANFFGNQRNTAHLALKRPNSSNQMNIKFKFIIIGPAPSQLGADWG